MHEGELDFHRLDLPELLKHNHRDHWRVSQPVALCSGWWMAKLDRVSTATGLPKRSRTMLPTPLNRLRHARITLGELGTLVETRHTAGSSKGAIGVDGAFFV